MKCAFSFSAREGGLIPLALLPAFLLLLAQAVSAAAPISDYLRRLDQARNLSIELTEEDLPPQRIVSGLNTIKQILPSKEEVETNGNPIRIDNQWLHGAIDNVIGNANGDPEQLHSMLVEIKLSLTNLNDRVKRGAALPSAADQDARARLEMILARPDYRSSEFQESSIRRWARKIVEFLGEILRKLFGSRTPRPTSAPGGLSAIFFRGVILLATLIAMLYGLLKLAQLIARRKKSEAESEVREVLGEEIAGDVTAADLLRSATDLARKGEYRTAIRRAYIALLFELEQRGKLHLNRAKTNRDYLNALQTERQIYPAFSAMTGTFEHIWYGQQRPTEEEFNQFLAKYRETTRL